MLYIIFAIISSTLIFITFKLFEKFSVNAYQAVVINYFTAGLLGLFLFDGFETNFFENLAFDWRLWIILIGTLFFLNFLLIQYSTKNIGMTTTSVACKISVVIPIIFSIIYDNEKLNIIKLSGILTSIMAIAFLTYKKEINVQNHKSKWLLIVLPIILFFGLGITDAMVKYTQQTHATEYNVTQLTSLFFTFSFISSIIWGFFRKKFLTLFYHLNTILIGIFLGLVNFGSIFFLILSLKQANLDDSLVFGMVNLGIILLSVLIGFAIFKEMLYKLNWFGVLLAIVSFVLLSING